jgi:predicted nucleic acid-binding protein
MNFSQIPAGSSVFLDANVLIYHFASDPNYGAACTQLIRRIELQQLHGITSSHVLADVAHRLMTLEAIQTLGWPVTGIAARLRNQRAEIAKLRIHHQAVASVPLLRILVIAVDLPLIVSATQLSQQHQLLTGDALILAVMQSIGLTQLASLDDDFDYVGGISRYVPI